MFEGREAHFEIKYFAWRFLFQLNIFFRKGLNGKFGGFEKITHHPLLIFVFVS